MASFMEFHPVGAAMIHVNRWTGGQTDRQTWIDRHGEANRHFQSPHKICIGNVLHLA
jgi:hypothetical protein